MSLRLQEAVPDWSPFIVLPAGVRPLPPRGLGSLEGVGDRLRSVAFAELQARTAFLWASDRFPSAPDPLREAWLRLAVEEEKHLDWLLGRMEEIGASVAERPVSARLWESLCSCESARQFTRWMAGAEERGQSAGERLAVRLSGVDPVSAAVFAQIAKEEAGHVALANRFLLLLPESLPVAASQQIPS